MQIRCPIECDDDGCFVIKRLQGQECGSVPVDEVGEGHAVDTPMDRTQPTNRAKVNVSLKDPRLLAILGQLSQ